MYIVTVASNVNCTVESLRTCKTKQVDGSVTRMAVTTSLNLPDAKLAADALSKQFNLGAWVEVWDSQLETISYQTSNWT